MIKKWCEMHELAEESEVRGARAADRERRKKAAKAAEAHRVGHAAAKRPALAGASAGRGGKPTRGGGGYRPPRGLVL